MIGHYEQQVAAHTARRDAEAVLSVRISRLRLAAVVPAIALLVIAGARTFSAAALIAGLVLLLIFLVLVVWHAKVDQRVDWHDALRTVNLHALARIGRAWDRLPPADDPPPDIEHHPYAQDLDLFGRASLLQWLGPAATAAGARTLQQWVLAAAPAPDIAARQRAIAELAAAVEWREYLAAHGRLAAGVRRGELEAFLSWAESPGAFTSATTMRLRVSVLAITAAIWSLIALQAAGVAEAALLADSDRRRNDPVVCHGVPRSRRVQSRARSRSGIRAVCGSLRACASTRQATHRSCPRFEPGSRRIGADAPECLRRLNRILGFAQLRAGAAIFHFPIQALTLWDFHVFFALDALATARWGRASGAGWTRSGSSTRSARWRRSRPTIRPGALPEVVDARAAERKSSHAPNLGHPLIHDDRRVGNDVEVGPPGTLLLITGSNMSGKSTLLRAIGLNAVLAQAGGPVCAAALRMPTVDIETSIRVQDSLEHGLSYFMAALARLKGVLDRARQRQRMTAAGSCCICSTRFCRAPTPASGRSRFAASRGTCSTPARSAS